MVRNYMYELCSCELPSSAKNDLLIIIHVHTYTYMYMYIIAYTCMYIQKLYYYIEIHVYTCTYTYIQYTW